MMQQPDLFGSNDARERLAKERRGEAYVKGAAKGLATKRAAPHNGTDTSRAAAARQTEARRSANRTRVLSELQVRGSTGATCDELEQAFGMSHQTASALLKGMRDDGLIRFDAARRKTRTGSPARVYYAVGGRR